MNPRTQSKGLKLAVEAACSAGALMRKHAGRTKKINEEAQHDIKLELDVRCQKQIERSLLKGMPDSFVLGEEGSSGNEELPFRWVVDPIDGTVNYAYGIPHACVSIALQEKVESTHSTQVGVVYDPFCDELWTAVTGGPARLNGRQISVSQRTRLSQAIVAVGFAKYKWTLAAMLPMFGELAHRVRKVRIMGSAALSLTYVASGRFDAYAESGIRLWDIAAGGLIVECAGGEFWRKPIQRQWEAYEMISSNGLLRKKLEGLQRRSRV